MYNILASKGVAKMTAVLGDSLKRPVFFTREKDTDTYVSYTGYDVTCELFNIKGEVVATAVVTVADAVPPNADEVLADSKISIFIGASDMPTKTGNYALVFKKTLASNNEDVETFLVVRVILGDSYGILV